MSIDWNELYKIRLASSDKSMDKHDIVKILLVRKLLRKHKGEREYIRIYTEFYVLNDVKCDVYYENIKTKEAYAYEIQKSYTESWIKDRKEKYKDWNVWLMKSSDFIPIDLNELSDDINELNKQLDKYIF